jgi:hypothetical protein
MGCDLLALDLVSNWEFMKFPTEKAEPLNIPADPRNMLRRRSSLVVDDLKEVRTSLVPEMKSGGVSKPAPTVFEEPEANSLLDSFGF